MPYRERLNSWRHLVVTQIIIYTLGCFSTACGAEYKGFRKLTPEDCVPIDGSIVSQLPRQWHKYAGYIKICGLKKDNEKPKAAIVSIWVNEYFAKKYRHHEPHKWEDFPLPLIVTTALQPLGTLPEIYPVNDITSTKIYFGKWKLSMPMELRIDVVNPAEGGDYYYAPLIYGPEVGRYEMKIKEVFGGRRP